MKLATADIEAFLRSRGWRYSENTRFPLWSWREPRTRALYTLKDAYELEKSRHEKSRPKRKGVA